MIGWQPSNKYYTVKVVLIQCTLRFSECILRGRKNQNVWEPLYYRWPTSFVLGAEKSMLVQFTMLFSYYELAVQGTIRSKVMNCLRSEPKYACLIGRWCCQKCPVLNFWIRFCYLSQLSDYNQLEWIQFFTLLVLLETLINFNL